MARLLSPLLPLAAACCLAACAQQQAGAAPDAEAGTCQAKPAQFAVGYNYTEAVLDEVRRRSGARLARVLRPGQMTTMEFSAERVNLEVDAGNRVTRVRCG
jgi:hypothetical protein